MAEESEKKVFLQIRVSKGLKKDFERVCTDNDLTASQVLRAHMRDYVSQYLGETGPEDKPQSKAKGSMKVKGGKK